jgi:hypothetical protein
LVIFKKRDKFDNVDPDQCSNVIIVDHHLVTGHVIFVKEIAARHV